MDLDAFATYWFGRFPDLSLWFYEGDHYDHEVERFRPLFDAVADGRLGPSTRTEALLTLVVLDQLPRHLYRGSRRAYAYDGRALALARQILDEGWHHALCTWHFIFWVVVFEHSEDLDLHALARRCLVERITRTTDPTDRAHLDHALIYLDRHSDVIRSFGRYPIRAAVCGLPLTEDEERYVARRKGKPY
ncbi:MAG: DUF924 domain-containing protein [Myxococcales bacterium]|nr:DUF924 domain-containing protein [Myxococcales bacterium]